jgi:hypothetical protein
MGHYVGKFIIFVTYLATEMASVFYAVPKLSAFLSAVSGHLFPSPFIRCIYCLFFEIPRGGGVEGRNSPALSVTNGNI